MTPQRKQIEAAVAAAEMEVVGFYDDFSAFLDRCVRLGELDGTSADNVKRCMVKAREDTLAKLRAQLAKVRDDIEVTLTDDEVAAFQEWRATELERRRWLE